jgi:Protein of unknown function (DUF998)
VPSRATAIIVIVAAAYWWAVFLAMHVLEPEFSPLTAPGSAYVLGTYGAWMTTTYFVLGVVLISAGLGLNSNLAVTALTRIAGVAFLIAAAGAVSAGLFPMDFPPPPRTLSGRLHALSGVLTFLPWAIGTLLFSLGIRRDHRWARRLGILIALSVLSIVTVAVLPFSIPFGFAGAVQRLLLTLLFAWLIVVALQLIRPRLEDERSSPKRAAAGDERRLGSS